MFEERNTLARRENQDMSTALRVLMHVVHRTGDRPPPLLFEAELASTRGCHVIGACATVVFRGNHPCSDPADLLHPMEGRIQRALFDAQGIRQALNVRRDGVPMQWTTSSQNR